MKNLNKMKIAGDMQFEIGQDKVSHFPTWEVKDDKTLCKKVEKLKRSTFDLSKFTVVGSPVISEDGVLTTSDRSLNYIKTSLPTLRDNWDIIFPYNRPNKIEWHSLDTIFRFTADYTKFSIGSYGTNYYLFVYDVDGNNYSTAFNPYDGYNTFTDDLIKLSCINGTTLNIYVSKDRGQDWKLTKTITATSKLYICDIENPVFIINTDSHDTGASIDLKNFSITVDGKEVFSGNKTGSDVIKPDNYTVVGSPVITDDGVASGFSESNYLIPNVNFNSTANVEFLFKNVYIVISNAPKKYDLFFGSSNGTYAKIGWSKTARTLSLYNGSNWVTSSYVLSVNTFYDFKLNWNGTTYSLYAKLSSENEWIYVTSFDNSNNVLYSNLWIGRNSTDTGEIFGGSIDLNSFKIYVDGNLVYQPCLKIPYTESKTGSKIVDSVYRDRVQDLFEQVGYNGYFTLGENDFTLPTHKFSDVIDCYENGINKWEQRVDRTLRQQGSCTADEEVTLLKPYKDTNYVLNVPYASKTETGFIPTISGDWIANGKVYLD